MTFSFLPGTTVSSVDIGLSVTKNAGIALPSSVTINGEIFNLTGNELADQTLGTVSFPLSTPFFGSDLIVSMTYPDPTGGPGLTWLFVDEVRFIGSSASAAPEPGTLALLSSLAIPGFALALRRRRS
ncbi:MAG: PEP-CTERM sorting domain-containing protein [Capsulimonadales bacterium]|nr:PEP-CTERM sorting domain-containing protein [Capsulimonadales bacterium]